MNGEKRLFINPWRKTFLTFLQRRQSLVSGQSGLIEWNDAFRKRMENLYLVSLAHRVEIGRLPWDYTIVLRLPIVFRTILRAQTYGESHLYRDKGITADRDGMRRGIISFLHKWRMRRFDQDSIGYMKPYQRTIFRTVYRDKRYDRAYSGSDKDSISSSGGSNTGMDQLYRDQMLENSGRPDNHNPSEVSEGSLIKAVNIHFKYKVYKRIFTEREGRAALGRARRISVVNKGSIQTVKPYKRAAMKAGYEDIMDGDVMYGRTNSGGMTIGLTSNPDELSTSMDKINGNHRRNFLGGTEHLNPSSEAQDAIREPIYGGLKPLQQTHLPVVPFRYERVDPLNADIIYAIPPWTEPRTKKAGRHFNSVLTSDISGESSRPGPLKAEREFPFYNNTRRENPFWEKKERGKTGVSIDYIKVADRVYEILTRRIIREKERMGE